MNKLNKPTKSGSRNRNSATAQPETRPQAVTEDLVSSKPAKAKIDSKWEPNYRHLSDLRDHFLRQRGTLSKDANEERPTYSEHMADAGTDSYDRDFALGMLSSDSNAIYEIEEAIRRIESGTYGICELTGKPIQRDRLSAIPWTRFSIEAEHQLEKHGAVGRARLGNLGSVIGGAGSGEEPPAEKEAAETRAGAGEDTESAGR